MAAPTESRVFSVLGASITPAPGGWDVLVRTGAGALTLRFSPSLASGLLVLPRPAAEFTRPKAAGARPNGNAVSATRRAAYIAAFVTWKTASLTQREACAAHSVPYYPFQSWLCNHRAECEAALAAHRAPVVKPGGKLL